MGKKNGVDNVVIQSVENYTAAGTSAITSDEVDTANCESVTFLVKFGAIESGAVTSVKVQQFPTTGGSGAADLEGSGVTVLDTDDNKVVAIEIVKPRERYLYCYVSRATQNSTVEWIVAIKNFVRKSPTGDGASIVTAGKNVLVSPAEGTA